MRYRLRRTLSLFLVCLLLAGTAGAQYSATGKVNVSALRLRAEPSVNAAVLTTLQKNEKVMITSEEQVINNDGTWYAVSYGSHNGYMSAEYLDVTESDTAEALTGVTTARVNFRSAASLEGSVLKVLPKGTAVQISTVSGEWYQVLYNGVSGYIHAEYISFHSAAALYNAPAATVYNYTGSSTTEKDRQIAAEAMALSSPGDTQKQLLEVAVSLLGTPYVYGTAGTKSFDCSGFTSYVYKQLGISIQRTALNQYRLNGTAVSSSGALQTGDLVFFRDTAISKNAVSHVGIYIGQGLFIHASSGNTGAGRCVKVSDLTTGYYGRVFVGGKRVL